MMTPARPTTLRAQSREAARIAALLDQLGAVVLADLVKRLWRGGVDEHLYQHAGVVLAKASPAAAALTAARWDQAMGQSTRVVD
jgi:hypothetical protein